MKLTKYKHACFAIESDDEILVVDPGNLTLDLPEFEHVTAIVITHEHPDHFHPEIIRQLVAAHPNLMIVGHDSIMQQINELPTISVIAGDKITVGAFNLEFAGGTHAAIHPNIPPILNLGVCINSSVYYPGDSFTLPPHDIDTLALPAAAPWMKTAEAMDYLRQVAPKRTIPTHDAVLSDAGRSFVDNWLSQVARDIDCEYTRLDGQSIVLK